MGKQLARKGVLSYGIGLFTSLMGLVSLVFVKNYMGYEAVGMIAFATSFFAVFKVAGDLGFTRAHHKRITDGYDFAICNGLFLSVKIFLTVFLAIFIFSWMFTQKLFFGFEFESMELEIIVYIMVFNGLLVNLSEPMKATFGAKLEIAIARVPKFFSRLLVAILKISVALAGMSALYLAVSEVIGTIFAIMIFMHYYRKYPISKPTKEYLYLYGSFAIPVMFVGLIDVLVLNTDKLMLGLLLGVYEVGIYTIPQRITEVIGTIALVIFPLLFVRSNELFQQKRIKELTKLTIRTERFLSMVLLPIVIICLLFGGKFLVIFGEDSHLSVPILSIIVVAMYISKIMNVYHIQLIWSGQLKAAFFLSLFTLLLNTILNFVFILDDFQGIKLFGYGIIGAAYATLAISIIRGLIARFIVYRTIGTSSYYKIIFHFISASLTIALFTELINHTDNTWIHLSFVPLSTISFFAFLFIFREFQKQDFDYFIDKLNPKKMWAYVRGEMLT